MQAGTLTVKLLYAAGLHESDLFGKQDPYAKLRIGSQQYKSKTHKNGGKNPVWNETFKFSIVNDNTLSVELWDEDTFKDDLIGQAVVDLAKVRSQRSTHETVAVARKNGKQGGSLVLDLEFEPQGGLPMADKTPAAMSQSAYGAPAAPAAYAPPPSAPGYPAPAPGYPPAGSYSAPPAAAAAPAGYPGGYPPAAPPAPSKPSQGPPAGYPPSGYPPAYSSASSSSSAPSAPPGYPGAPPAGYPPAAPAGYPGAPPAGYPGAPPAGYPGAPPGYPPAGYPPQSGYPSQSGYPPQGYSHGYPPGPAGYPPGYGGQPGVMVVKPPKKHKHKTGAGEMALGVGAGLLGGMIMGEMLDDLF